MTVSLKRGGETNVFLRAACVQSISIRFLPYVAGQTQQPSATDVKETPRSIIFKEITSLNNLRGTVQYVIYTSDIWDKILFKEF